MSPADLDAYMQRLLDRGRARSSRIHIACTIRTFFRWLQEEGRIVGYPAKALPVPDDGDQPLPPPPLSEEEVARLIDALPRASIIDLRNRAIIEVLYGCGLRANEALGLDLDHVDPVRKSVLVKGGKGDQDRKLPLMGAALAAVRDYLAVRRTQLKGPDHGALFLDQFGQRLAYPGLFQWFRRLNADRRPGSTRIHAHLFRHCIAVHLLRGGADIRHVQAFLGHARIDTTKVYLRLVTGRLKEDYDKAMPEVEVGLHLPPKATPT